MRVFIVGLVIVFIVAFNLDDYLYKKRLFEEGINSMITDVKYQNRGGYQYMFNNSYFWGSSFNLERDKKVLNIGDSISKAQNSKLIKVYRKDEKGVYVYFDTFQSEE